MSPEDLEAVRRIVREELDRKPEGWQAYVDACVAWFEHDRLHGMAWRSDIANKLQDIARASRPPHV